MSIFWGDLALAAPVGTTRNLPRPAKPTRPVMSISADVLYKMTDLELLRTYHEVRRQFVEKKFARDTDRARLAWLRAKMFVGGAGGVTERNMAIEVSEELARKGQELREMTRDLDLLKVDVDLVATVIRLRGASAPTGTRGDDTADGSPDGEGHVAGGS